MCFLFFCIFYDFRMFLHICKKTSNLTKMSKVVAHFWGTCKKLLFQRRLGAQCKISKEDLVSDVIWGPWAQLQAPLEPKVSGHGCVMPVAVAAGMADCFAHHSGQSWPCAHRCLLPIQAQTYNPTNTKKQIENCEYMNKLQQKS